MDAILMQLRTAGPRSGAELCASLGISAATLSRRMAVLRGDVLVVGRARQTRYAAKRAIEAVESPISVVEVGEGPAVQLGALHAVYPGFYFESATKLSGFYRDIPWFLNDLRPSGFLGRIVPVVHPTLGAPADVRLWSGDHVLRYLTVHGSDLVGNLVVGSGAFSAALANSAPNPVPEADRVERYPELAACVSADGLPGSSAAGEQPKFLATRVGESASTAVLVKFSPVIGDRVSRRLADLLRLECLALATVAEAGIPAAKATILEGGGRVFLEVERFDRLCGGGRRGVVSFASLDDEFIGSRESWSATADALLAQRRMSVASRDQAVWLDRFGAYIANRDRHHGNLSCFLEQGQIGRLCPVYDMLPMLYAPTNNELVPRTFVPPTVEVRSPGITRSAWTAATRFWTQAAELPEIEADLRLLCDKNARLLRGQTALIERLPLS